MARALRPLVLLAACLLSATLALAALGPRYGGRLTVAVAELPSLDPGDAHRASSRMGTALAHETLFTTSPDGEALPSLAEPALPAADGREWTVRLRPGLRFHDGAPIEAGDVARTIRRFLRDPASAAARRLASDLDGGAAFRAGETDALSGLVTAGDALVLRFVEPLPAPLRPLESAAAAVTGRRDTGAGPFVPATRAPGLLALTAFGAHVRGRPLLDEVVLRAPAVTGGADLAPAWGAGAAPATTLLLVLDAQGPFSSLAGRHAVADAMRRAAVPRFVAGGEPAAGLLAPGLLPSPHPASLPAGAPARLEGSIVLGVAGDVPPEAGQRVTAALEAAGLRVAARAWRPGGTPRPAARLLAWSPEVAEPALALDELATLSAAGADTFRALDAARRETEPSARQAALARVEAMIRAGARVVPLAWMAVDLRAQGRVHGVRLRGATPLLEDAWVEP